MFGRLYTFFSVKTTFLVSILIFEVGSAVCGAAPTSNALIIGRAIAGVGSAGIYAGAVITTVYCIPLEKRMPYQAVVAAIFGVTSVLGPLLGGGFTDKGCQCCSVWDTPTSNSSRSGSSFLPRCCRSPNVWILYAIYACR